MTPLPEWLKSHQEKLVQLSVQQLATQEVVRQQAQEPINDFFTSLIQNTETGSGDSLDTLLRKWAINRTPVIDNNPVGILPVLSVLKQVVWDLFQTEPPAEDAIKSLFALDSIFTHAVELVSKVEASSLLDALSHHLVARSQLRSSPDVKDNFVSVAAHELKTPLTVIEGYTNMLKMEANEQPRSTIMIQGIESGIVRLRELIEDLIDVSLLEMNLLSVDFQPVWLNRLIDIAEMGTKETLCQRQIILDIKRDTIPGKLIAADPERLLQAFQKILANAIKYTPDGGRVTIFGRDLNGFAEIVVQDTGIGIASEHLELIFEKFPTVGDVTLHSSGKTKFKGGGPGLGLSIARGIIEAHGGSIWAESPGFDEEKCPGSQFHILIPMRPVFESTAAVEPSVTETQVTAPSATEALSPGAKPTAGASTEIEKPTWINMEEKPV
jgi:signal transduction histidine kinase